MWFIVALFVIDIARLVPKETMVYLQTFTVFYCLESAGG